MYCKVFTIYIVPFDKLRIPWGETCEDEFCSIAIGGIATVNE